MTLKVIIPAAWAGQSTTSLICNTSLVSLHRRCNFFLRLFLIKMPLCLTWKEPNLIALSFAKLFRRDPVYRHFTYI